MVAPHQTALAIAESAVSETVKRVNAEAFDLLTRRSEINRRIRSLQQVVQGLHDLVISNGTTTDGVQRESEEQTTFRRDGRFMRRTLRREPAHPQADLIRACRIALMEAGGIAPADEIRARICRRGSFSFSDSTFAEATIIRTLEQLEDRGEFRRVERNGQSLWQRLGAQEEGDTSR